MIGETHAENDNIVIDEEELRTIRLASGRSSKGAWLTYYSELCGFMSTGYWARACPARPRTA